MKAAYPAWMIWSSGPFPVLSLPWGRDTDPVSITWSTYCWSAAEAPRCVMRLTTLVGARWLLVAGCVLYAAGLLLTNVVINPNPSYLPLAAALGLAGVGIGTCVVPVTSSVLGAVPAERSGMAASASNTSREFGAVTGIAILGAVVNAELRSGVVSRMTHLGASAALQQYVLQVIETGSVSLPHGSSSTGNGPLDQIIQAGYAAFTGALHAALYLSAALLAAAALLSAVTLRHRRHAT